MQALVAKAVARLNDSDRAKLFASNNPRRQEAIDPQTVALTLQYLYWFGYISYKVIEAAVTVHEIITAVKKFQKMFGLVEDGKVGPKTRWALHYPRCGHPDFPDHDAPDRKKFQRMTKAARWQKANLTYCITDYVSTEDISKSAQEAIIAQAWKQWMDVTPLKIERTKLSSGADIVISTGRGPKDDFDGPGGTLAYAFMPEGDDKQLIMRFDLDETWMQDPRDNGIAMLNVACHEFGHLLGLDHSKKSKALMAPFYNESVGKPQPNDDIARVQKLYGHPSVAASNARLSSPDSVTLHFGGRDVLYVRK